MPSVQALNYDPTLKTVTVAGDIATVSLTSIVNQTKGKDLFVVGRTPITNRVFSGGNTTFTLDTNTEGDSVSDVLAVRYQSSNIIASLDNGYIINGVAHFNQPEVNNAGPTTRPGNAPLVIGDKWYNTTRRSDWRWGGTYWEGDKREHGPLRSTNLGASFSNEFIIYPSNPNNLSRLLISFYSYGSGNPAQHNINNHYAWSCSVGGASTTYVSATYNSITGWDSPAGNPTNGFFRNGSFNNLINFNLNSNTDRVLLALQSVTRVGTPPAINFYNTWITIQDVL